MKILNRYILKEHVGPFVFSLLTLVFIFLINTVFRDLGKLLDKGISLGIILQFFALNLAWIVALAVPMAVLTSTLMAFGRFSADHELTALKSSGIHFYRLVAPVMLVAVLLAVGMERFNNLVLPDVNHQYSSLLKDIRRKSPTVSLEPQVFNDIETHSLYAERIDNDRNALYGIIINDYSKNDALTTILADSGTVNYSEAQGRMVLTLFSGEMHEADLKDAANYRRGRFDRMTHYITIQNAALERREKKRRGLRERDVAMLKADVLRKEKSIAEQKERMHRLAQGDWENLLPPGIWNAPADTTYLIRNPQKPVVRARRLKSQLASQYTVISSNRKSISNYEVEIHKKYSIPLACVVFVLIGAPLGFMARQGGIAVGGMLSLIFFLIYWIFLIGGENLADRRYLDPAIAMWLPNVVVGAAGIYLMMRSVREASFIDFERITAFFKKWRRRSA